jgi:hypothetical protein
MTIVTGFYNKYFWKSKGSKFCKVMLTNPEKEKIKEILRMHL